MISDAAVQELMKLREEGMLTPRDVLERARDKESALHEHFEWDNCAAGHAYRMDQAKHLIVQAKVRIIPRADDAPRHIRAVVQPAVRAATPLRVVVPPSAGAPAVAPTPSPTSPARPGWSPLIAPSSPPTGPGDDDNDDDDDEGEVARDVSCVMRLSALQARDTTHRAEPDRHVDKQAGSALLRKALGELVVLRRRYAHLEELTPVFSALDQLAHAAVEPEASRLRAATYLARSLMDREGVELQTAASRAAEVHQVDRWELLEALRSRAAG